MEREIWKAGNEERKVFVPRRGSAFRSSGGRCSVGAHFCGGLPRRKRAAYRLEPPLSFLPVQRGLDAGLDYWGGSEGVAEEFLELVENRLRVGDEGGVVDFEHLNAVAFFQHLGFVQK